MKVFSLDSTAFKGTLKVDRSCKFKSEPAIKSFKEYVESKTSDDLTVRITEIPPGKGNFVRVPDMYQLFLDKKSPDYNEKTRVPQPTVYRRENLKITYESPKTSSESTFYFEVFAEQSDQKWGLEENLKINAALDLIG